MKKNRIILLSIFIVLLSIPLVLKLSYASNITITSDTYEIKNNTIYAIPTSYNLKANELIYNLKYNSDIEIYNKDNVIIDEEDNVETGYTLKIGNDVYNIVILGDVTGDGSISLGDVSALYNHYKNNRLLNALKLEAGLLTKNNNVTLGDVSKLYNFYKGKKPFTFYSDKDILKINDYIELANNYYNNTSRKIGTNIVDELNIEDKNDNDQIILNSDGNVELAIIRNNRCYRKSSLSSNIDIVDKELCNTSINGFVSNNGKLHINGNKILNERNEEVILKGFSSGTSTRITQNWSTWYTDETFKTVHNWGTNFIRFTLKPEQYKENPDLSDLLINYIDLANQNDLYILISWMGNSDFTSYTNEAKEFFNKVSYQYKDYDNILYEICNEPFNNKWSVIKNYADEIIPIIRNNDSDAIIVVPASYHITDSDDYLRTVLDDPIDDINTIYSTHMYVGNSLSSNTILDIKEILDNNKVIMISEWGTTASDGSSGFYKKNSDLWLSFLNDNNISWLNFNLSDVYWNNTPYDSSVVQMGKWNSKLKDYILSESGKYIKNVLTNNNNYSKKNMLMSRKDDYAFFKDEYKNIIKHIEFKNNNYIPDNYDISWDVSLTLNNTVKAYLVNDTLYISSIDDELYAPSSMKYYFSQFTNLESVNFTNLNTSEVNNMSYLFYKCSKLNSINYSNIDTSKVTNISLMYSNCTSLTDVDMSNLDFSNVTDISLMFIWASKLNTVKLPYLNEQIITKKNDVFYKSASQTSSWKLYIDINNQNYINELINNSTNPNLNYTLIPN